MDATDATDTLLYVEEATAVCLYIYTLLGTATEKSRKILLGSWKTPVIYFGQDSGYPVVSKSKIMLYNTYL